MAVIERFYGKLDSKSLVFEPNEVALRLKTKRGYTNTLIEDCKNILLDSTDCRYCAVRTDITISDSTVLAGDIKFESRSLVANLRGAEQCFIMAVTLGTKVDMLLKRLSVSSMSEHYVTDALASALAEVAADMTEDIIKKDRICCPRFSPGYADLALDVQADVLKLLDAQRLLGITLSKSYLMTPQKTVTAIIGIK